MRRSYVNLARCSANLSALDRIISRSTNGVSLVSSCSPNLKNVPRLPTMDLISPLTYSHNIYRHFSIKNLQPEIADEKTTLENLSNVNRALEGEPNSFSNKADKDIFDSIDYDAITGGDPDALNKFKLLLLEVDVLRQDGMKIPSTLSTEQWKELFSLKTRSQRRKSLGFLWTLEMKKISDKRRKERKRLETLEKKALEIKENENNDHIRYGFQGNTIFMRLYDTTINLFDNHRLAQAMIFGQNIVVDCGYENNMSIVENKLCAKQLTYMFAENRLNKEPFNINFCNINKSGKLYQQFLKHIPTIEDPAFPINISEEHYLKLFPRDKLVYLTPHCREELKQFNCDDIYIIGALVDKQNNDPLSMAKAKSEGIRMAQLPLDRYLDWGLGTKSLTVNQVLKILLDVRATGNWNLALNNVPKRKVRQPGEPARDTRKFYNRGTILQPPHPMDRRNRIFQSIHYRDEGRQEQTEERTTRPRKH
uniref:RNA (guanine-9-)-methyltransferase domain-containing protein 1 n=1 Tax=Graphocephala atropunctata TaxID=36148 RepID=A0A1B6L7A7_9HEMI